MVLPFKIKLKKDCTKNASVVQDLCSISEMVKPSSKIKLLYSKIAAMWHVQVKSPTHYFGSFLIQTNLRGTQLCCLLLDSNTFQDHFKIARALPQLHKSCEIFYRSNLRWPAAFLDTEKNRLQVWCYKNSSWSGCFNAYMNQKNTKNNLTILPQITDSFLLDHRTPSTFC